MKKSLIVLSLILVCFRLGAQESAKETKYNIIPYPAFLEPAAGKFIIGNKTVLVVPDNNVFNNETRFLKQLIQNYIGTGALKLQKAASANAIVLKYDSHLATQESYTLVINSKLITLTAKDPAGMFYAIETLRQLLPADMETGKGIALAVPCVKITDHPAFQWRGMMLDVSRHFFSIEYLKKYVDMMALYKLNKLHLHLTDDQGWRIEIKKYPKLTSEGAWRTFNNQDSACMKKAAETGDTNFQIDEKNIIHRNGQTLYGGSYTQDEMREFIQYASYHHIEVVPEIDMPGHMMAAAKIYPELTCDTIVGNNPNEFSDPICPCNPHVLEFAKDIFTEIANLFPSKYIHIGGDEVNKRSWEKSLVVQNFMKEKGFTNMNQIQSYFNDYMLAFFKSKGKTLLGWDEIIEGGIDSSAVMMFWRSWAPNAPMEAAKNHNKVIMTPDGPLYFDAISDAQTLPSVYNYNPFDTALYHLTLDAQKNILGVQANLWTEMIPSEKRADYMILPRLTALAELGWTHHYDYASYLKRLNAHYDRLDKLDINYRLPDLSSLVENYAIIGKTPFYIASPLARFTVHYTVDGTLPNVTSPIMDKPVMIAHALIMKLALFTPSGRRGDVYTLNFREQQYSENKVITNLKDGLTTELYKGSFERTTAIKGKPDDVFMTDKIAVPSIVKAPAFGLKFKGYIQVPETGIYTFYLTCNDGGVLYIGGQKIIDNDGLHSDQTKGGQVGLQKGLHPIMLDFMEYGGGYTLDLKYSYNDKKPQPVPVSWLKSENN